MDGTPEYDNKVHLCFKEGRNSWLVHDSFEK